MLGENDMPFDLSRLKDLFGSEGNRPSLVHLLRGAEAMGYATVIATLDWEALRRERRPAITRLLTRDSWGDYVLLLGVIGDEVVVVDGDLRQSRLSRAEFATRCWSGWVVILQRQIESAGA